MVLVGNKCDMKEQRRVFPAEGQEEAARVGLKYFDVSAKENYNISECFEEVMNLVA